MTETPNPSPENTKSKLKALLKKKLPLAILIAGLGFVFFNYYKKQKTYSVSFRHEIFSNFKEYKLSGKIYDDETNLVWAGEFSLNKKIFKHSIDLFSGRYSLIFIVKNGQNVKRIEKKIKVPPENVKLSYSF